MTYEQWLKEVFVEIHKIIPEGQALRLIPDEEDLKSAYELGRSPTEYGALQAEVMDVWLNYGQYY